MLQSVFRDLGLHQDDVGVQMVRETIALLPAGHPLKSYIEIEGDELASIFRETRWFWWVETRKCLPCKA